MSAARKLKPVEAVRTPVLITDRKAGTPMQAAQFVGDVAALVERLLATQPVKR